MQRKTIGPCALSLKIICMPTQSRETVPSTLRRAFNLCIQHALQGNLWRKQNLFLQGIPKLTL